MFRMFIQLLWRCALLIGMFGVVLLARIQQPSGWLAFWRPAEASQTLMLMDSERRLAVPLGTYEIVEDATLDWSSEGVLAFNTGTRQWPTNILLFDVKTLAFHDPLPEAAFEFTPVWSHDSRLAFVSYGSTKRENIFVYDLHTHTLVHSTQDAISNNYAPAWSPDGRLAFVSRSLYTGSSDIFIQNEPAGSRLRVTHDVEDNLWPDWTAQGDLVYGTMHTDGYKLYRFDGGTSHVIVNNLGYIDRYAWSLDGRLAFSTSDASYINDDVYMLHPDSDMPVNLTNHPARDFLPTWSPDGRLSFISDRNGSYDIFILNLSDNSLINLTQSPEYETSFAWMPHP